VIRFQLKGAFKEALICTDSKVIIVKGGFMTGQVFGTNVFQMPYKNIAGVEIKFHLVSGYFEISSGGMQNTVKSYWSQDPNTDPAKAPNCVSINRSHVEKFRAACNFILSRLGDHPTPQNQRDIDPILSWNV